ncbi:helix-turn-helix domain-containing protein [Mycoplasmatota bacterium WC44]
MGRPKGGKNRYWSKEEKFRIISRVLSGEDSIFQIATQEKISDGLLTNWIKKYRENGIDGLENKKKPGNPLAKFSKRKDLSELEQLQYENMKLRIENERLKRGYTNEIVEKIKKKN